MDLQALGSQHASEIPIVAISVKKESLVPIFTSFDTKQKCSSMVHGIHLS
jgi:hypothetical protein